MLGGSETASRVVPSEVIEVFDSPKAIIEAMRCGDAAFKRGNTEISTDLRVTIAESTLDRLRNRLATDSRVTSVDGEAQRFLPTATQGSSRSRVTGAYIRGHGNILANLTLVATGAWTSALMTCVGTPPVTNNHSIKNCAFFPSPSPLNSLQ